MTQNVTNSNRSCGKPRSWRLGFKITWPVAFLIAVVAATFVAHRFLGIYSKRFGESSNIISVNGICRRIVDADEACVKIEIKQCGEDIGAMTTRLHKSYRDMLKVLEESGIGSEAVVGVSDNCRDLYMSLIEDCNNGFKIGHSPAITTTAASYRAKCMKSLMTLVPHKELTQTITIRTKKVKEAERIGYYLTDFARNNPDLRVAISTSYILYPETRQKLREDLLKEAVSDANKRVQMVANHTKAKVQSTVRTDILLFNIEPYGAKYKMVPYATKQGVFMYVPPESEVRFKEVYLTVKSSFRIR